MRRLRLHGLIERLTGRHRYQVTDKGLRLALFFTRTYARVLQPGLSQIMPEAIAADSPLRRQFEKLKGAIDQWVAQAQLAA